MNTKQENKTAGREPESRRELSYDGRGINGPDEFGSRLATFTSDEAGDKYGKLFEAVPELLAACEAWELARKDGGISHADLFEAVLPGRSRLRLKQGRRAPANATSLRRLKLCRCSSGAVNVGTIQRTNTIARNAENISPSVAVMKRDDTACATTVAILTAPARVTRKGTLDYKLNRAGDRVGGSPSRASDRSCTPIKNENTKTVRIGN